MELLRSKSLMSKIVGFVNIVLASVFLPPLRPSLLFGPSPMLR